MSSKPPATPSKGKKPRAKRGVILDEFDPNWEPLLTLARIYVDEFMWMYRVELRGGIRLEAYKHRWSRRYLFLTADGRSFGWRGNGLYGEIEVGEDFDWAIGRTEVWWSIPRYTDSSKMPKVMVSMPDELLAEVDAEAQRLGTSRSAVLRGFAEAALERRRTARAKAILALIDEHAEEHGGNVAELVKATRPQP